MFRNVIAILCATILAGGCLLLLQASPAAAAMTFEEYQACKKKAFDDLAKGKKVCNLINVNKMRARASCIKKAEKKFCNADAICWLGIGGPKPPCAD